MRIPLLVLAGLFILESGMVNAQYRREKDASIPLEYFYIERKGHGLLRRIISKVHVGLNTGVGVSQFKHTFSNYGIIQNPNVQPQLFNLTAPGNGYSNWFNTVTPASNTITGSSFMVSADTAEIGFRSRAINIPLQATLHVEIKMIRIGGGYSFEYMNVGDFKPISFENSIGNYEPEKSSMFLHKYFGMIGGAFYRWNEYVFVGEGQIGGYRLPKIFDKPLIDKGVFFNLGLKVEKEISTNFKLFIRPSYELKRFKLAIPDEGELIHRFNAIYVNVGFTYRFPELRRCVFKECRTQINHAHGNREYRSRVHAFYKNQNPHYGENYPTLIKYKGKNKKKLNPY